MSFGKEIRKLRSELREHIFGGEFAHHTPPVAGDFDHQDLSNRGASDHHTKYTDLEAQTACKLNGTVYWSCSGIHFDTQNPDVDDITKHADGYIQADTDGIAFKCAVSLPNGCTVTAVKIYGNIVTGSETWELKRIKFTDQVVTILASEFIGDEDIEITNAVIDNSGYGYFILTSTLDTNDKIYGVRISFTL